MSRTASQITSRIYWSALAAGVMAGLAGGMLIGMQL